MRSHSVALCALTMHQHNMAEKGTLRLNIGASKVKSSQRLVSLLFFGAAAMGKTVVDGSISSTGPQGPRVRPFLRSGNLPDIRVKEELAKTGSGSGSGTRTE